MIGKSVLMAFNLMQKRVYSKTEREFGVINCVYMCPTALWLAINVLYQLILLGLR